jgi:hypothetical protein
LKTSGRRQENLINELERLQPSGDPDVDQAWRHGIQHRFAATVAEQRTKKDLLAQLHREQQAITRSDINVLDDIPQCDIDLTRLPDDQQRRIYDAFHLEIRYNTVRNEAIIRVTVTSGIAPALAATVGKSVHQQRPNRPATGTDATIPSQRVGDVFGAPPDARIPNVETGPRQAQVRLPGRIRTGAQAGQLVISESFLVERTPARAAPVYETVQIDRGLLDDAAARVGVDRSNGNQLMDLAAVAMTRLAWRDGPVEDWHSVRYRRIGDAEMMRANGATTRAVREVMDKTHGPGGIFKAVGQFLADPLRRLPDGRSVLELAPSSSELTRYLMHLAACCTRWKTAAADVGEEAVLTLLACRGAIFNWHWWLSTGWPQLVDEFVRRLDDPTWWRSAWELDNRRRLGAPTREVTSEELFLKLLAGPDRLDAVTAQFCIRAGLSSLLPQDCGLPPIQRHLLPDGYFALIEIDPTAKHRGNI